jgi:hypothetical protein
VNTNKHNPKLEVLVYWKHRNDYEWRLRDESEAVIAKGRASNYAKAKKQGAQQAKRVSAK